MKVLILASSFSGLCQRVLRELLAEGHKVEQHYGMDVPELRAQLDKFSPEIILCPFLTHRIPEDIWRTYRCLIVHPGIEGDRGPSSLDWAIRDNWRYWGVTLLQADAEMDAGDIWGTAEFPLRNASKTSLYKREVSAHAMRLIKQALVDATDSNFRAKPLNYRDPLVKGECRELMRQPDRAICWATDSTESIVRKLHAADTTPGVQDHWWGQTVNLYGAIREPILRGEPGTLLAVRYGAVCRATTDGAIWIRQMKVKDHPQCPAIKLPAASALARLAGTDQIARLPCISEAPNDIRVENRGQVAYIYFDFYNGAANTEQCLRLRQTLAEVKRQSVSTIVLMGGEDFFSNGIHLNCIEAAASPADESWANINAIDDVVQEIINSPEQITVAALRNNAGAGGAILALACDRVVAREGVVLNPHYANMGLFGSEYWTYLLPKKVGAYQAQKITTECQPLLATEAFGLGFADTLLEEDWHQYHQQLFELAERVSHDAEEFRAALAVKARDRAADEAAQPLAAYRSRELAEMHRSFYDPGSRYHQERRNFVYKGKVPELLGRSLAV